jgi:hypothetical protein
MSEPDKYMIFKCARALELGEYAAEQGFAVWLPIYGEWRMGGPKDKRELEWHPRTLAFYGYIYVRAGNHESFIPSAPSWYNVSSSTQDVATYVRHRDQVTVHQKIIGQQTVTIKELKEWQSHLDQITIENYQSRKEAEPAGEWLTVGDTVVVGAANPSLEGLEGEVLRIKSSGAVRIRLNQDCSMNIMEINKLFLRKVA